MSIRGSRSNQYFRGAALCVVVSLILSVAQATAEPIATGVKQGPNSAIPGTNSFETRTLDIGGGIDLAMVWIPAGEFIMGTMDSSSGDEKPPHRVRVTKGFWMGKYEVTQAQWDRVMATNEATSQALDMPVYNVSWNEAQAFASNLNTLVVGKWNGPAGKFRLPTEIEWEYACRAGSTNRFCSGNKEADLAKVAWYFGNSERTEHPVGTKAANAWGLYDMHGNVSEWCANPMDPYPLGKKLSASDKHSDDKVSRGGGYAYSSTDGIDCSSTARWRCSPTKQDESLGMRIVLDAP